MALQLSAFGYQPPRLVDPRRFIDVRDAVTFEYVMRAAAASPYLVFDFETSGLAWYAHARACGIALGFFDGQHRNAYIPFRHRTGERQLDASVVIPAIRTLLALPMLKIGHNLKFDLHIARVDGIEVEGFIYDTFIASVLFDENNYAALKERAKVLLDVDAGFWEEEVDRMSVRLSRQHRMGKEAYLEKFGYCQHPIGLISPYASYDSEYTYGLYCLYEHRFNISTRYARVFNTEMDLVRVLLDMESEGVPVNAGYLENIRDVTSRACDVLDEQLRTATAPYQVDVSSDEKLREYLTKILRLPLKEYTLKSRDTDNPKLAVGYDALAPFRKDYPIVDLTLKRRDADKLRSTYTESLLKRLDVNGYLHCDMKQVGTNCMPAGELVLTSRGYLPVEAVKTGDLVVTHAGRTRPVTNVMVNGVRSIVRVKLSNGLELRTTENHAYHTQEGAWVEASALRPGVQIRVHSASEEWRVVTGWEDFSISSWGRVWNTKTGFMLTQYPKGRWGHLKVCLYRNGSQKRGLDRRDFTVHRLVAAAFHRPGQGSEVRHLNGCAWDNTVENLCWGTSCENRQDAKRHGTMSRRSGRQAKLTPAMVAVVRATTFLRSEARLGREGSDCALARRFGVTRELIRDVRLGKRWVDQEVDNSIGFTSAAVIAVSFEAPEQTYGLTVQEDHSHVTAGIVTHNTGRLASASPNLQNIASDSDERAILYTGKKVEDGGIDPWSIKRAFTVPKGYVRLFADYCLAEGTLIDTPSGDVPIEKLQVGDIVYTYNHVTKRPDASKVAATKFTGTLATLKVTLDNGETVRCTPNHRWLRHDGVEVLASELQVGTRLLPLRRGAAGQKKYETLYARSQHEYVYAHKAVYCAKTDIEMLAMQAGFVVHHRDEDHLNNSPENLEALTDSEHKRRHGLIHAGEQWKNPETRARMVAGISQALKDRGGHHGENNPNFGNRKGQARTCAACNKTFYRPPSAGGKYCSSGCYNAKRQGKADLNHRVVAIEFDGLCVPTFDIEVARDHNFALSAGVFVHNSQIELRVMAFYSKDPIMVEAYLTGEDLHARAMREINRPRRIAKVMNFGLAYCLTAEGLARQAEIPLEEARAAFDKFAERYSVLFQFRALFWARCRLDGNQFQNLWGRPRRLDFLQSWDSGMRKRAERQAIGSLIQGTAAELTKESLVRIWKFMKEWKNKLDAKLRLTIHDEIQTDVAEHQAEWFKPALKHYMEDYPQLHPIPITVDIATSTTTWADKGH